MLYRFEYRKRGKQGPPACYTSTRESAISTATSSSKNIPGMPIFFPYIGTTFNSYEEAKEFYNLYSWEVGFGIRMAWSKTNNNEYTTRSDIVCSCEVSKQST